MFERMLDKNQRPDLDQIIEYIGEEAYIRLCKLEEILSSMYILSKELRFPFGNNYGWGYKYSHRSFHLCYVFFERGAFTVTIQIGDRQVSALMENMPKLTDKTVKLWENRYPCGETGGWVHLRVLQDTDVCDARYLVRSKKAPIQKV